jgi:hypothetical protein
MILTSFIKHISKSRTKKSIAENIMDIENAYLILTKPHLQPEAKGRLYNIVIGKTKINNAKALNFKLTNLLFKRIHQKLKDTNYYLNYLFVLEYPTGVALGLRNINNTDLHAHITINTNLPQPHLEKVFRTVLRQDLHFYLEDISDRLDLGGLANYYTKQSRLNDFLTHEHYNYKIDYRSTEPRKSTPSNL